jgi:hypothetical protein
VSRDVVEGRIEFVDNDTGPLRFLFDVIGNELVQDLFVVVVVTKESIDEVAHALFNRQSPFELHRLDESAFFRDEFEMELFQHTGFQPLAATHQVDRVACA